MRLQEIYKNIRLVGLILAALAALWFYKDYSYQKKENVRQTENAAQARRADSLKYSQQILTAAEIKDYLSYKDPALKKKLDQDKIKLDRIESIVSQTLSYKDDKETNKDLSEVLQAIKNKIPSRTPFKDSTSCLTTKGYIDYKNDSLKIVFTSRDFKNKSDGVLYWQRREWSFLGIKTRLLGKKEFTSKNYSDCGEIKIEKIEKLK